MARAKQVEQRPIVKAIADVMWRRDLREMRAVDALLALGGARPGRKPRAKPVQKRSASKGR